MSRCESGGETDASRTFICKISSIEEKVAVSLPASIHIHSTIPFHHHRQLQSPAQPILPLAHFISFPRSPLSSPSSWRIGCAAGARRASIGGRPLGSPLRPMRKPQEPRRRRRRRRYYQFAPCRLRRGGEGEVLSYEEGERRGEGDVALPGRGPGATQTMDSLVERQGRGGRERRRAMYRGG